MKIGRNEPCWCNSGKKYKYCHLDRDKQGRITVQDAIKGNKKALERKCLHPEANEIICDKIIKAHSIQRANILEKISKNKHVYCFSSEIGDLIKNNGWIKPKLIGINDASTFTGFCNYHDTKTFKPIELNWIEILNEHIFLIAYRSLCKEIYAKKFQSNMIPLTKEGDKGLDIQNQLEYQEYLETYRQGVEGGLRDLLNVKVIYDKYLLAQNYDDIIYYVIEIEEIPDFLVSGQIEVEMDFNGKVIQTLDELVDFSKKLDRISLSILMRNSNGLIIFSCFKTEIKSIDFLKSISSISNNDLPDAIARFVFEYFENNYFSPNWWDSLSDTIKETLIKRFNASVDFKERPNNILMDDGNKYVNWKILNRYKNF